MLVPSATRVGVGPGGPDRPLPKSPEVLVTTASTGEGVPELLVALDRHRATLSGGCTPAHCARS